MKSWVATKPRIENNPQIWTHMAFGMLTLVSLGQSELFKYSKASRYADFGSRKKQCSSKPHFVRFIPMY